MGGVFEHGFKDLSLASPYRKSLIRSGSFITPKSLTKNGELISHSEKKKNPKQMEDVNFKRFDKIILDEEEEK